MAIRNVAKTFTFEQQRREINNLSGDVGDITNLDVDSSTNLVDAVNLVYDALTAAEAGVIGLPTDGSYTNDTYAILVDQNTKVADAVDGLNTFLGRIIPPQPQNISNISIDLDSYSLYRYCSGVTGLDNGITSLPGAGSTIKVIRTANYTTELKENYGPGNSGTLDVTLNGVSEGSVTFDNSDNSGTYQDLVVSNNVDYGTITGDPQGFWQSYDFYATGSNNVGWNELKFTQSGLVSQSVQWLYDTSNPGQPTCTSVITEPQTTNYNYSSGIAHFSQANSYEVELNFGKLSGNVYPLSNDFITSSSVTNFTTLGNISYSDAGISLPLPRNYLSTGTANYVATLSLRDTHNASSTFPTFTVDNGYQTVNHTPSYNKVILIKGGTPSTTKVDEQNIVIGEGVGTGSGSGVRVNSSSAVDNPASIWNASTINYNTFITLNDFEATVVGGVLKHDVTDYTTNYLPYGPNLNIPGRSGAQYFTFKFSRSSVQNFTLLINSSTGIAGAWMTSNIPLIQSLNSSTNGWLDLYQRYSGSGIAIGGCAIDYIIPLNTALNNTAIGCTFGSESSSNSSTGDIFVRIKLTSGQSVSSLSISPVTQA